MTVYQRIMQAAKRGGGLRLSAADVFELSIDDAIQAVAANDDGIPPLPSRHLETRDGDHVGLTISSNNGTYFTRKKPAARG